MRVPEHVTHDYLQPRALNDLCPALVQTLYLPPARIVPPARVVPQWSSHSLADNCLLAARITDARKAPRSDFFLSFRSNYRIWKLLFFCTIYRLCHLIGCICQRVGANALCAINNRTLVLLRYLVRTPAAELISSKGEVLCRRGLGYYYPLSPTAGDINRSGLPVVLSPLARQHRTSFLAPKMAADFRVFFHRRVSLRPDTLICTSVFK